MLSFKPVVLFLAAAAAAATTDRFNQDVTDIDSGVKEFTRLTKAYMGDLVGAPPLLIALSVVAAAQTAAIVDSGNLPRPIPVDDFVGVVRHVNQTVAVDNPIAVDTLISKKREFERSGLALLLAPTLRLLLEKHEIVSNNLLVRVPPDAPPQVVAQGKRDIEMISEEILKAIRAF